MYLAGEYSLIQEHAVVCCDLHRRVSKGHMCSANSTHTVAPREHCVLGLWPCRNQVIPPHRGRNSCIFGGRSKHATIMALREFPSLVVEIF